MAPHGTKVTQGVRRLLRIALCLVLLVCVLLSNLAFADDDYKTVRVGYYENEVFQEGASEGAVKTGYAYEYYRKLSEYTGWEYEYVYGDYVDLYQELLDGKIDLLAGLAWREDRVELMLYPQLAMGNETYSLVKHTDDESVTIDPQTLAGKRIGVLDSAIVNVLNGFLEANDVEAEVVPMGSYEAIYEAFEAGEIDVVAAERDGASSRDDADVLYSFGASDYYLCVNKNRPDLLAELNEAQAQLQENEPSYLSELRGKYYPVSIASRSFSASEKGWLSTNDSLRVGYLNHYLPYSDTDSEGNPTGIIKDIIPKILGSLGISDLTVTYVGYESYDEIIEDMAAGNIDVAFPVGGGLYYSEENGIYQSNVVVSSTTELVYRGDYRDDITDHFAVNENNRMQYYYVKTNFPDAEISLYPSIEACLEAVKNGEVGCTTLNGMRANDILKNRDYRNLSLRQLTVNDDRCFGVKIGNEGLLKLINRGLHVIGSDYAQNLAYRYAEGLYTYSLLDVARDHMAALGTCILGVAAVIITLLIRDSRRTKEQVQEKERARLDLEEKNRELAESREALADALVTAEHASNAKTAFLNNMSHDIRTPMNAIVGFTALASTHLDNPDQVKDYLGKINTSSQHLLSLINDVLDMSRIESGKVTIEETPVHLPDLIHDLKTIIQPNVTVKHLELFVDTQDVVNEDIITDGLRLNQVLLNILSNAIKFTPEGGTISLRVIERPCDQDGYANFEFRVKDTGIGMSPEFQEHIFEPFTREKTSTVSGIQGTGLGMAITKNIVDMMGGTITVNSEEGVGSEFIVSITCQIDDRHARLERLPELQGLRVQVADDDTNTCLSVCSMLRDIGMRPDWTNFGQEAVARAVEASDDGDAYATYIIDWMLPDLGGIEVVRKIRQKLDDNAPIIILTAYDWADIEEEARAAGVTAFCSKPLFMSELQNVLAKPLCSARPDNQEPESQSFEGKRVLLVEDSPVNQEIAITVLESVNLEVDVANDGTEAVEIMENTPAGTYDLILMDILMPKMNGYEASRRIRALDDPGKASIPIIAVTANAFDEDRKKAMEAGMNAHLAKPYDIPQMLAVIADTLA